MLRWWLSRAILFCVILSILPFTVSALRGELSIGGDRGQHNGIERLAVAIKALPGGAKVYDFWLGWELRYYLGDQPPAIVIFEPSPEAVARAVCADHGEDLYFVAPADQADDWLFVMRDQHIESVLPLGGPFRLYHLSCGA